MYESELINIVEEGKEYKREILEEFVLKHHYHLYSKTMGSNLYLGGQVMCVVEKVIEGHFRLLVPQAGDPLAAELSLPHGHQG